MGKKSLTLMIAGLLLGLCSHSAVAQESTLPDRLSIKNVSLKRCSQAELKAFRFIHVGSAALYLTSCTQLVDIFTQSPKRLRFVYQRSIPATAFQEAAVEYLKLNLGAQFDLWQEAIEQFNQGYKNVEEGDYYDLNFHPKDGLSLALNGTELATIDNPEIGLAYLNIWFGKHAFSDNLKASLLTPERL
ncbi:MAG: chalcone isomerase family protein [Methyloprofundus sp.]|nr:chalcone isomerase family protein [Methyloprofundus sp.]